jgi:SAM-dependent methyltransferase
MDAISDKPFFPDTEPDVDEMLHLLLRVMRGVNGQAFRLFGDKVMSGPFVGMTIPERTPHWDDGNSGVKLAGTYEHELHEAIEHAIWRRPRVIINVGCAEGYYTIGLARLMQNAQIIAFDTSPASLDLCREYATRNKVADRISVSEGCHEPSELRLDVAGHRLYVVDCEGAERELIDPERCPELANSDLIVECHDFMWERLSSKIADRLSATHRVELILPRLPDLSQFRFLRWYPTVMSLLMVTEKRPMPSCWLVCWANRRGD